MESKNITLSDLMNMVERKDSEGIAEILTSHKELWNRLMEERKKLDISLAISNITAREKDLSGIDLEDVEIEGSDFSGSDFSDSMFDGSRITNTNMAKTNLYHAGIDRMWAMQTDLSHAKLYAPRGLPQFTGSVNLFNTYIEMSEEYSTSPATTIKGFKAAEAYEHADEGGEDNYRY